MSQGREYLPKANDAANIRLWNAKPRTDIVGLVQFEIARRLAVIVLSVALSTGVVLRSAQAIGMDMTASPLAAAATADTTMPMPGKCDGCAGDEKAVAACSAFCANAFALLPTVIGFVSVPIETVGPGVEPSATGYAFPPDPHPPKPFVLN